MSSARALDRVDRALWRAERGAAGALILVMGLVVFGDVVHRVFTRVPGRTALLLSGWTGQAPEALDERVVPALSGLVLFGLCYLAVRTRRRNEGVSAPSTGRALGLAAALALLLGGAVQAFIVLVPEGLGWAPYFGLTCLLWSGLLGASAATYRGQHLALEMGEKLWPESLRPLVRRFAGVMAGSLCAFIAYLGVISAFEHYHDWRSAAGAGLIPSLEWPKWAVFTVVPYAFGVMTLRFWGRAAGALSEPEPQEGPA